MKPLDGGSVNAGPGLRRLRFALSKTAGSAYFALVVSGFMIMPYSPHPVWSRVWLV